MNSAGEALLFTVVLPCGGSSGFTLTDGTRGNNLPAFDKIRKGGKVDECGILEGDYLLSINGRSCQNMKVTTAMEFINVARENLSLQILRASVASGGVNIKTASADKPSLSSTTTINHNVGDKPFKSGIVEPITAQQTTTSSSVEDHYISMTGYAAQQMSPPSQHLSPLAPTSMVIPKGVILSALPGVIVHKNKDESFTMTIGMPFDYGPLTSDNAVISSSVVTTTYKSSVTVDEKLDSRVVAPNDRAVLPSQIDYKVVVPNDRAVLPLQTIFTRGLTDSSAVQSTPNTPGASTKKKMFIDSAFYDDPHHRYPTVDEQISLARAVAQSVLSPANLKSRGHKMFMKRKIRAAKWTTGATDEEIAAVNTQNEDDEIVRQSIAGDAAFMHVNVGDSVGGLPSSVVFAKRLPKSVDKDRLDAMSMEELEQMQLATKKTTHMNVSPQVCFNLAGDLKNMSGKGGKLFAKRQAKSESWGVEKAEDVTAQSAADEADDERKQIEQMAQIRAQHRVPAMAERSLGFGSADDAPGSKLKKMADAPKPSMTPWEAVAQNHGDVDKSFEHLGTRVSGATNRAGLVTSHRSDVVEVQSSN